MRLDLSTSDWHKLLKPVLPHAATGKLAESQPHLGRVRLELRAPRTLYAAATDRYTLAVERHQVSGDIHDPWPPVEIELSELKASLTLFAYDKDADPELQVDVDKAPIPLGNGTSVMSWAVTVHRPDDGMRLRLRDRRNPDRDLGDWRTAVLTAMTRPRGRMLNGLDIPAQYLARWQHAARGAEQLRIWTGPKPGDPLLFTVEQHFAGIMAAHQQLDDPSRERASLPWAAELMPAGVNAHGEKTEADK